MGFIGDMVGAHNNATASAQNVSSQIQGYKPQDQFRAGVGQGPKAANLQNPFNTGTANELQGQTQGTIGQQQQFVNALQAQGGIGNQAAVFGQQQALANQLQQQAMGGGPNPALAQLSQATGNNIRNQAALMAGQRGASHNAGLMAKNIATQASAAQGQAAGQAATLQAQQQLAAQQALQGQQASMANLATQQVGQQAAGINTMGNMQLANQQQVLGQLAAQNQANVAMQSNLNNVNQSAQQGANQINAQMAMQNNQIGSQMAMQGNDIRAGNARANAQNALGAQGINAQVAGQNAATNAAITGGVLQGAGAAIGGMAHGGFVPGYADGGAVAGGPSSSFGRAIGNAVGGFGAGMNGKSWKPMTGTAPGTTAKPATGGMGGEWFPNVGMNPDEQSSGPLAIMHAQGGAVKNVGSKLKTGGSVPGKAKVKGDSLKNDTVNAKLSPGEVVIPRSVMTGKDPVKGAADFVAAILARKGR